MVRIPNIHLYQKHIFHSYKDTIKKYLKRTKGLKHSNNLKSTAKLEKYKIFVIDTSLGKSRDFNLVSFTS
jgi:hypothetical protein